MGAGVRNGWKGVEGSVFEAVRRRGGCGDYWRGGCVGEGERCGLNGRSGCRSERRGGGAVIMK